MFTKPPSWDTHKSNNPLLEHHNNSQNPLYGTVVSKALKSPKIWIIHFILMVLTSEKTVVDENRLNVEDTPQSKYNRLDDEIFEDMQRQLHFTDSLKDKSIEEMTEEDLDRIITPQHRESVRKLGELLDN